MYFSRLWKDVYEVFELRSEDADARRTTLTRHQNHHGGVQTAPGAYVLPYRPPGATVAGPGSMQHAPLPPYPYHPDPLEGQIQSLGIPPLPPPTTSYPGGPPQPPYGSHPMAPPYTTRSTTRPPPPQRLSQHRDENPYRYPPSTPTIGGQSFPPSQLPPPSYYDSRGGPYPGRPQREESTSRPVRREYPPIGPYDIRYPPGPPPELPQPSSFQPGMPPPGLPRVGQRRPPSQMESAEETEEDRERKRRRTDQGRGS